MKIVIIVQFLTGGGAERVAALWAKGFAERGYEVAVAISHSNMPITYKLPSNVKLMCFDYPKRNKILKGLGRMWRLRKLIREEKPDVVIDVQPALDRILARTGLGCYNISTEHDSFERPANADIKLEWFSKFWINRLYDHVTVLTQADKDIIGNRLKHVSVLPNPLALEPVKSIPPKDKIVLAVGRKDVWHYKGFDILIKAWSQVSANTEGWRLQIVGGSDKGGQEYLKDLCYKYGVSESVEFQDFQEDILPYYQQASIFVLSSRYEGFGLVLIEAMSQGCACVACDYKGRQSEIVGNRCGGITCEPDNEKALACEIELLIEDVKLRSQLQVNAIFRASAFLVEHITKRWEEILRKVFEDEG